MTDDIFSPPTSTPFEPQLPPAGEKPEKVKRRKKKAASPNAALLKRVTRKAAKGLPVPNIEPTAASLKMQIGLHKDLQKRIKIAEHAPIARAVIVGNNIPTNKLDSLVQLIESYEKAPADVKEAFRRLFG